MRPVVLPFDELEAAYRSGLTIAQVAARFGTTRSTVQRRLTAAGRPPLRRNGPRLLAQTIHMPSDRAALGYIAGMFDGEGNLGLRRRANGSFLPRVAIYSTTREAIDWLAATMGGHVRWDHNRGRSLGKSWKPMGTWTVWRARDVQAFLTAVLPYLIIKRDLARSILDDLAAEPAA